MEDLVSINNLNIEARTRAGTLKVVNDLSFTIKKSETLCVVGESGCGKSTVARLVVKLYEPTNGEIIFGEQTFQVSNPEKS